MDSKVAEYMHKQKSPLKEIIEEVREIFKKTLPMYEERMTWGVIALGADKFYIAAMKNRVHVGFAITGLNKDEVNLFEGSGKTMRHVKIHTLEDIDEKTLAKLIKMVDKKAICKPC